MGSVLMDLILPIISDIQRSRYSTLAASTIIVYDHLVTLDQEIDLVWNAPWSMGKILFFLNRYYPLCVVVFNQYILFTTNLTNECMIWLRWQGWTALGTCMIAETILQLRLYALYFLDKKVLFFMVVSFIATSTCSAFIMGHVLSNFTVQAHVIPGFPFCIPLDVPHYLFAFWIPIIAFESLLCGMALFRGFQAFRYRQNVLRAGRHLVTLLLRDSIIYYIIVFVAYFTNLILWGSGQVALIEIPAGFSVAMSCVMGNRLILNVRHMKREMEETIEEKSVFRLPLTTHESARNPTPSMVEFVKAPPSPRSPISPDEMHPDFEFMELRDMRRDSIPEYYVMAI